MGHSIWRRLVLVPFDVRIPEDEKDKDLLKKLEKEWPRILRWAVQGCLDWQEHGLEIPEKAKMVTREYRSEYDILGQFLEERCEASQGDVLPAKDLYKAYSRWAEDRGEFKHSSTKLGRMMTDREYERASGNQAAYLNLRLKDGDAWNVREAA